MCRCHDKSPCPHPEKKRKPQECTPEQIRECHGDATEHPCEQQTKESAPG